MAKRAGPPLPIGAVAFEEKTYRFPGAPVVIYNPRPHCFIPMGIMPLEGHEVFVKDPADKAYPTYELAKAYLDQQMREAAEEQKRARAPQLYVPPGRGKVQA